MKKIIFLLPPSEGKNLWDNIWGFEKLSFNFQKPKKIVLQASQKDLKCTGKRYEEWTSFNKKCVNKKSENYIQAIERYSGVMYNAIAYDIMFESGKKYFEENIFILSGMYGILKSTDIIWNYKLPIETKWLYEFWRNQITEKLNEQWADCIINLLPLSYQKTVDFKSLNAEIVHVNFYTRKNWELKKMTHWVKKIKWEWLKNICESWEKNYHNFWWIVSQNKTWIEVQIIKNSPK